MAKAKKQESAAEPAKKKSPAAARKDAPKSAPAAAKKSTAAAGAGGGATKKAAKSGGGKSPGGAPQVPLIDTGLAARTAAAMVASGLTGGDAPAAADAPANRPESASFKNLKQGLNKPSAGSLGGILGTGAGSKKFTPGFGTQKQGGPATGGRNQTFGADVNRANVPRRTGGG